MTSHGQGVGYNFSALRPKGAWVKKTDSQASGAVSFMHPFDTTCKTVESAGSRRGAQMGILNCEHPDIVDFVRSKDDVGVFTQFNLSVGISNAFMAAVEADAEWDLVHVCEPHPDSGIEAHQRGDGLWVYQSLPARELWDQILRSTYDHDERVDQNVHKK